MPCNCGIILICVVCLFEKKEAKCLFFFITFPASSDALLTALMLIKIIASRCIDLHAALVLHEDAVMSAARDCKIVC